MGPPLFVSTSARRPSRIDPQESVLAKGIKALVPASLVQEERILPESGDGARTTFPPMPASPDLPIFAYTDFRKYLEDYYLARKRTDRKFSHRFIQEKVVASSAEWFADVAKGRT